MVSLLTALLIQSNEVEINLYQDGKSKKWGYEVSRMERGNYRLLVDCQAVYDSREIAQKEGEGFVKSIKKLDLKAKRTGLADSLGDFKKPVQSIIDGAKGSP